MDYSDWTEYDLLETLELSGRLPEPALIAACLERGEKLVPGLLEMLASGTRAYWDADDPRWYRDVHAGMLLIALGAEDALPLFDAVLRDPEREEVVHEWFESWLPNFGPALVPVLAALARDAEAWEEGRYMATRLLGVVGERYPEAREEVVAVLHTLLPTLRDDGTPAVTAEEASEDDVERWTWVASSLEDQRDRESLPIVEALYAAGLVDEEVLGDIAEYRQTLDRDPQEADEPWPDPREELVGFYEDLQDWDELSDRELVDSLLDRLVAEGMSPEDADLMRDEMEGLLADGLEEEGGDEVLEQLQAIKALLRAQGVPDERLDDTLNELLMKAATGDLEGLELEGIDVEALLDGLYDEDDEVYDDEVEERLDRLEALYDETLDYSEWKTDDLLDALELAGQYPELELLAALLDRREEATPLLLEMLRKSIDDDDWEDFAENDPRWYREVHAGHLLVAYQEAAALPTFKTYLDNKEQGESFLDWFSGKLSQFGRPAIPTALELLQDEAAWTWGRIDAADALAHLAEQYPDERPAIVQALRAQLPSVGDAGRPVAPEDPAPFNDDEERSIFWAEVVYALARLRDEDSRPLAETLFKEELLDETLFGGLKEYRALMAGEDLFPHLAYKPYNLLEDYARYLSWAEEDKGEDDDGLQALLSEMGQAPPEPEHYHAHYDPSGTLHRDEPKIGRNERVTLEDPASGDRITLKYKHAQGKLDDGWRLVGRD